MKYSTPTLLAALLALTTVGTGALAWHQHQKLVELQDLVSRNADERAEWQARLSAADRGRESFDLDFAPFPMDSLASPADVVADANADSERRGGPQRGGFNRGDRVNPMVTLMQNPDFARAVATQQKAALDLRYADLFRKLNLTPEQVDRFKDLLIERQSAASDVMAAARDQGMDGRESRDELRKLVQSTQAEVDDALRAFLGESAYNEYRTYEQTQPQRALVGQLETKLSYSGTPLQDSQMDQLVRILAETAPQGGRGGGGAGFVAGAFAVRGADTGGPMPIGGSFGGSVQITDEAIARAQGVLSQNQLNALKQMQAEQQAQRQMAEAVRNATSANRPGRRDGGPAPAPSAR